MVFCLRTVKICTMLGVPHSLHKYRAQISGLERHLDKRIGGEPMPNDPVTTIPLELKCLTIILAYEVRNAGLGKPNAPRAARG